jgi:phosphoglycolate phosphatase
MGGMLSSIRSMRPTVLLFDIDGTLLETGGAGRRAMAGAFREAHQKPDACTHFAFAGMTDRAIVREGLKTLGSDPDERAIDALLEIYLRLLASELERTTSYRLFPAVAELVQWLTTREGVAVGLGTGNVRSGAYLKLARGGIDGHFAFGGFGCDAEDRIELLRAGARRGAEALGAPLEACRVVVIGDTPRDVAAARGLGVPCIGVGTGGTPPATMIELGAVVAFDTLADAGVRDALLG